MKQTNLDPSAPSDPGRRRFTRGGLAAPVLLGTLASKPILGHAGFACAPSNTPSGNASARGNQAPCNTRGLPPTSWLSNTSWPAQIQRGVLGGGNTPNPSIKAEGTPFPHPFASANTIIGITAYSTATASQLADAFKIESGQDPATMLQVLMKRAQLRGGASLDLGEATVASLLNAFWFPSYPVSAGQIIAMFNAANAGIPYRVGGMFDWYQADILKYFQSLYQ